MCVFYFKVSVFLCFQVCHPKNNAAGIQVSEKAITWMGDDDGQVSQVSHLQ